MKNLARIWLALACLIGSAGRGSAQTKPSSQEQSVKSTAAARESTRLVAARTEQVRANLALVREILNIGLADDDAGELLQEARRRAPDPEEVARLVAAREHELAKARLERVRLLEQLRMAEGMDELARRADELSVQEQYLTALQETLAAERTLAKEAAELTTLLAGRLLWIRSAPPIGRAWAGDVTRGVAWLASPDTWFGAGRSLLRRCGDMPIQVSAVALTICAIVLNRSRLKKMIEAQAESVGSFTSDSFAHTVWAFVGTLLLALPVPLLLGGIGALLVTRSLDPSSRAVGGGMLGAASVYFVLDFFRRTCRRKGLAEIHFGWNDRARKTLLNNLSWLLAVQSMAAFVVAACDTLGRESYRQGLGRLALMIGSIALTVFNARVFRPSDGVFSEMLSPGGWGWRLRKLCYVILVLLPAALTIAAAAGYYYTANELQRRCFTTAVVVFAGIVVYSLLTRWLLVTRRRVAIQQARMKLAEQREARQRKQAADGEDKATGEAIPELDSKTVDVAAASQQTLALLRTVAGAVVLAMLWGVWKDVLPALTVLERIRITEPTLDAQGALIVPPLTLWSLLLSLITAVLTFVAARNLPALLQLFLVQRFSVDSGIRYAAGTLTRYLVIAAGAITISRLLGIDWSRAQWIIAALGVGLGFGLQEIVANFVSGLIILFERPIRVGDTVTVGDVSGTVSRLQIRATTITDADNKEVLVPNKSFITQQVVNWTLSSTVTRLVIRIGIAYGSDLAKAHQAIMGAVKNVPTVLSDPAPSVFFVGFGDSSLDFEIRAFVRELSHRLPTQHELNTAINSALGDAGIEIPFPQRDLHLRTSDVPLAEQLQR